MLLALIFAAIVASIGVYVAHNHGEKSKSPDLAATTTKPLSAPKATAPDPYAGWSTYSGSLVSLRYPDGWTAKDYDTGNGIETQIIAPNDDSIGLDHTIINAKNKHLVIDIAPLSKSSSSTCRETCKIYDATALATARSNGAKLVVSEWDSQRFAQSIEVIDDHAATVGAQTYKLGATIGGKALRIYGGVAYDTNDSSGDSGGWIADVPSFEKTASFQNLVKVINSITVK